MDSEYRFVYVSVDSPIIFNIIFNIVGAFAVHGVLWKIVVFRVPMEIIWDAKGGEKAFF